MANRKQAAEAVRCLLAERARDIGMSAAELEKSPRALAIYYDAMEPGERETLMAIAQAFAAVGFMKRAAMDELRADIERIEQRGIAPCDGTEA